jgi:hypothetical protein
MRCGVERLSGLRRTGRGRLLWLVLLTAGAAYGADPAAQARSVVADPDLVYHARFNWRCPAPVWERVLDEPLLMGRLWEASGYGPAYRFSQRGNVLHVDDPTGMQGDAVLVSRAPGSCTYLVAGKVDHWAVPFFNEGLAVFVVTSRGDATQISGELNVYVSAASMAASAVLALGQSLLEGHIDNRVRLNLADGGALVAKVASHPEQAAALLSPEDAARFRARFGR